MKNKIFEIYLKTFIRFLEIFGFAEWTQKINHKINGRDLVLIEEAKNRHLKIENLRLKGKPTRFYRVSQNGKSYFYETMPLGNAYNRFYQESVDNKWFVKKILWRENIPTADARLISSLDGALDYIEAKGYPIVVKPIDQSRCQGVTIDIRNEKELIRAIREVQKYGRRFLIEEFLAGQSFRVTVVNNKVAAGCLRKPPQVIGDGVHTISQLVKIKNKDPRRLGPTLCAIKFDRRLFKVQNLNLQNKPAKNQLVILNRKINLGSGADIVDVTEKIHPSIGRLCLKVAKIFDAQVLGLDILARKISQKPSRKNPVYIIEINSLPFIDMHHFPMEGKPRNVAGAIWQMVLK